MINIDAEVIEETVACPHCGQRNRLRKQVQSGIYRCGLCKKPLQTFHERHSRAARPNHSRAIGPTLAIFVGVVLVVGLLLALFGSSSPSTNPSYTAPSVSTNTYFPPPQPRTVAETLPSNTAPSISTNTYLPPAQPRTVAEPLQSYPIPPTGELRINTQKERIAPFKIISSRGSNYLLKLADAISGEWVLTVFVRGGDSTEIDVPLGTYVVKYASGETWYGYAPDHLFGPAASYSKASEYFTFEQRGNTLRGHSITLYKVINGNLRTEKIKPNEF